MTDNAENRILFAGRYWTQERISEIEVRYGIGFLWRNPHFPAPGVYRNSDGSITCPYAKSLDAEIELIKT